MNLGATDDQFDLRLLNAMIPHHEGAVVMANDALNKSKRPEIKSWLKKSLPLRRLKLSKCSRNKLGYNNSSGCKISS